jgi:serine/threonine protein kinase
MGITIIEFADGKPPHHDLHQAKAIMRIVSGKSPTLQDPSAWSPAFSSFLKRFCVKAPEHRDHPHELLTDPFVQGQNNPGVLMALLKPAAP